NPRDPRLRRAVSWHPSMPATLVWVERTEAGGDRVMTHAPPYRDAPREIFSTENRYAGLDWLENANRALVSEYDTARRMKRIWMIDGDAAQAGAVGAPPRLVGESSIDAAFTQFGRPVHKINSWGKQV